MTSSNSIVDEVRAAREALAKESDDHLEKIVEAARARQSHSRRDVVARPRRKTGSAKRASRKSRQKSRRRPPVASM